MPCALVFVVSSSYNLILISARLSVYVADCLGAVLVDASEYLWATLICSLRRHTEGPWIYEAAGG